MKLTPLCRLKTYGYEIPERYNSSVYIANASLFQVVGYFVHSSYLAIIHELVEKAKKFGGGADEETAVAKVKEKIRQIEYCDQFIDFNFPVRRAHGGIDIIRGMRVYHGASLKHGIALGGVRLVDDLKRHTMQGFAADTTYRNACYDLDFIGAHGGLKICKNLYDTAELKSALQSFAKRLSDQRGFVDVLEPDVLCGQEEMGYLNDACANSILVMGKPIAGGGINDYETAGARAAIFILKMFLENDDIMKRVNMEGIIEGKTFIIHGLGNMGKQIAQRMCRQGAVCVGIKDEDSVLYDAGGIPIQALLKHIQKFGSLLNFSSKVKETRSDGIFRETCDILFLASAERTISCNVAEAVKASVIVEACGGPVTPAADKILNAKSKLVIPSLMAGGGSSLMSYQEYSRNFSKEPLLKNNLGLDDNLEINQVFESKLKDMVQDVFAIETEKELLLNFRKAAYIKAIRKIFNKLLENEIVAQEEEKQRQFGMQ